MNEKLYGELAEWWPLLSSPDDYEEEAEFFLKHFGGKEGATMLELGCGGGNIASWLKEYEMTLVDLSPAMLAVSQELNPDCTHIEGDMRSIRLNQIFDRVFVHDAICYMTSEADLKAVFETAAAHLATGGRAIFVPDYVTETFFESSDHGGHDGEGRSMRYLEWVADPDPSDSTYNVDYVYVLREGDQVPTVVQERHIEGLFPKATWLRLLKECGFSTQYIPFNHSELAPDSYGIFRAMKR
jgi:SAM-dependent methyltransferase